MLLILCHPILKSWSWNLDKCFQIIICIIMHCVILFCCCFNEYFIVTSEEIVKAMRNSRRCIVVLSADFYQSLPSNSSSSPSSRPANESPSSGHSRDWAPYELDQALDIMQSHHNRIIPLIYGDFDVTELDPSDSTVKIINYVLKNLECLRLKHVDQQKMGEGVLKRLRLRLPPVRKDGGVSWRPRWLPSRMGSSIPIDPSGSSPHRQTLSSIAGSAAPQSSEHELQQRPWFDPDQPPYAPSSPTWRLSVHPTTMNAESHRSHLPLPSSLHPISAPAQTMHQFPSTTSSLSSSSMSISSQTISSSSSSSMSSQENEPYSPHSSSRSQYPQEHPQTDQQHVVYENGNTNSKVTFSRFDIRRYLTRSGARSKPYLIDNESLPDGFNSSPQKLYDLNDNWF